MRRSNSLTCFLMAAALAAVAVPAMGADDVDDPNRGAARISLINGEVNVRRGDSGDWIAAAANAPLVVEDRIATGAASRAEVQFDWANRIRLAADTEVRFTEMAYHRYLMQVARGTVTFSVLRDSEADVSVDTPTLSLRPARKGEYRATVREDGQTIVTVRSGDLEVFTPRGSQTISAGKTITVRGSASDPEFQIAAAIPVDEWDRWNQSRDSALARSNAYRYVNRDIYGAEDLDPYGSWVYAAPYGYVWRPVVSAGWAPYRDGRWAWADWYGWTWVSYDPWGWAPYHYGRWFMGAGGWCWYPGGMMGRHYWRPALVGFFGFGGRMGWVPLGPHEPFHAWYGRGYYGGYRGGMGHLGQGNIASLYRNARVMGGATSVSSHDFAGGRFHGRTAVSAGDLRQASLVRGQVPVAPTAANLRYSDAQVRNVPRSNDSQRFVSRRQPAAVERVPFAQQQRGFARAPGAAGGGAAPQPSAGGWRRPGDGPSTGMSGSPAQRGTASSGWRRFGEPGSSASGSTGARPAVSSPASRGSSGSGSGGWQRFGDPGASRGPGAAQSPGMSRAPGNSGYSRPDSLRIAPPVVRERAPASPGGAAPGGSYRGPSAPQYRPPSGGSSPGGAAPGGTYRGPSAPQYRPPSGGSGPQYRGPSGGSTAPRSSSPPASSGSGRTGGGQSPARR